MVAHELPMPRTAEDWTDIRQHYEDPADWSGYTDELDDEDDWVAAKPAAIPFPDLDQRVDDYFSQLQGNIGDQVFNLDNPPI